MPVPPTHITPWYSKEDQGTQSHKRLLLISYHFPPDAAVGARRWEKLAYFAAERGWGIDVITRMLPDDTRDPKSIPRLAALPSGVRIYQLPMETLAIQRFENRFSDFVRKMKGGGKPSSVPGVVSTPQSSTPSPVGPASASTPAPASPTSYNREHIRWKVSPRHLLRAYWATLEYAQYMPWIRQATQLAETIATPSTHIAVVSSGPPHMMHEAARQASVATGVPFVMDMRDPWSLNEQIVEHFASPLWYSLARHYERKAVEHSTLIVANTELARQAIRQTYPHRHKDIITVMNGADEDPLPPSRTGGRFIIAHAGTLYLDRDPRALFFAAARVIQELQLTPDQFGLEFIGSFEAVGGYPIHDIVRQAGIEKYVSIGSSLPHAQAMEFMANATMLVTMSGSNVSAIPAKTFECIRFEAWILALSAPESATSLLLQNTEANVIAPDDEAAIASVIRRRYEQHVTGVTPPRLGDDSRFSRRGQAALLFDAIAARNHH